MTCIVGMITKDGSSVIIGGDSAASEGCSKIIRKDPKVFYCESNPEFLLGCTSSYRMMQLLRYSLELPPIPKQELGKDVIFKYMCTTFIESVRTTLRVGGYTRYENGEESGGKFLVGVRDRLFRVDDDFQIVETVSGIDAVGSGSDFALGAATALINISTLNTGTIIDRSLRIATELGLGVEPPFIILGTEWTKNQ